MEQSHEVMNDLRGRGVDRMHHMHGDWGCMR